MIKEKSSRQSEASDTRWHRNHAEDSFFIARLRLTFYYSLTAVIILASSSIVLYKTLLFNISKSIRENMVDPRMAHLLLDRTKEILQTRFITIDSIIVIFIIILGFLLTKKTLAPIQESMRRQKRFIADASHELRTPIAIVVSGLEVALRNKNLTLENAKGTIKNTLDEMKEFSKLSNSLLDISKYDQESNPAYERVLLEAVILRVVEKMQPIAEEKNITIKSALTGKDIAVIGSAVELGRVLYNVLDNAIAYTEAGGTIAVSGFVRSNTYILTVVDTGKGITENILPKIFDPFVRGDTARSGEGAGLGLTLAKKIMENHSGTIAIKSKVGKGTTVTLSLPISS